MSLTKLSLGGSLVSDIPAGDGKIANFFYSERGKLVRTNAMLYVYDRTNIFLQKQFRSIDMLRHRVGRVLSFASSRWNWDSPNPSPARECAPHTFVPGGGAHSLARKGVGESQFQRGDIHCGTLYMYILCVLRYICTLPSILPHREKKD
jgi:hypothetical protein